MNRFELLGKWKVEFAHVYKADAYENVIRLAPNEIEVSFLTEGQLEITDGKTTLLSQKGDILCACGREFRVKTNAFHCHHTVRFRVEEIAFSPRGIALPLLTTASQETARITEWMDSLIYQPFLYADSPTKTANMGLKILCKIDAIWGEKEDSSTVKEGHLLALRAKKYVHKNLSKPITQRETARYLGVSAGYLCGQFKKAEGITLMAYVNRTKLLGVKSLMEKEGLHLKDACLRFGYADPNYVSHLYKKTFGRTITQKADTPTLPTHNDLS